MLDVFARGYAGCDIGILQLFISIGQLSFVLGFFFLVSNVVLVV
jgi:hypothetical protein